MKAILNFCADENLKTLNNNMVLIHSKPICQMLLNRA
jgi:hypothetical protein